MIKTYTYQVFSNNNEFLGTFHNVISEFSYQQNINSAGSELEIVLGNTLDDTGAVQVSDLWIDENGNFIVDSFGNNIAWSTEYNFNNIPIDLGNRVKVYVTYDQQPNGILVFDGFISKWESDFQKNIIIVTVLSFGTQLDNYLITIDPTSELIQQEVYDKEYTPTAYTSKVNGVSIAQSFNIAVSSVVGVISVYARASRGTFQSWLPPGSTWFLQNPVTVVPIATLIWELYSGTPSSPGSLIDSGRIDITGTNIRKIDLKLGQAQTLVGNYFVSFRSGRVDYYDFASPVLQATNTNPYAGGSLYTGVTNSSGTTWTNVAADDLAFLIQSSTGETGLEYSDQDPSTILTRILDQFNSQGGLITYDSDSVEVTGTNVSYTYKIQTVLEGIQKIIQLSPSGWYWYVDVSSNKIYFKPTSDITDHSFISGKHIIDLNVVYSLEDVVNAVYLSGGQTGGVNLYVTQKDIDSSSRYGQLIERISDNRVIDSGVAGVIISGELNSKSKPGFHTTIKISAADYDIDTIVIGQVVNINGANTLIDSLLFQIVRRIIYPDYVILTLGTLPPRVSSELENVKRRLNYLETIDNPASPS